jgi:hypothetical protein
VIAQLSMFIFFFFSFFAHICSLACAHPHMYQSIDASLLSKRRSENHCKHARLLSCRQPSR